MIDGKKVRNLIKDYLNEGWNDEKLTKILGFKEDTDQISFKQEALKCISFIKAFYPELDEDSSDYYKEVYYEKYYNKEP